MSVLHEERQLSAEHRRALKLLADAGELARARYRASRNREGGLPNDQGGSHPDYRRRPAGAGRMTKPVVATH